MGRHPMTSKVINDDGLEIDTFGAAEDVEIANGEALSGAIDFRGRMVMRIHMPDGWTAAKIGFKEAPTEDGTYNPLYDENGSLLEVTVAADQVVRVKGDYLYGARFVKLWSQNSGTDEGQAAKREITVVKA